MKPYNTCFARIGAFSCDTAYEMSDPLFLVLPDSNNLTLRSSFCENRGIFDMQCFDVILMNRANCIEILRDIKY